MAQPLEKLSVRDLWKVFGPHPERILRSELRNKARSEVQRETGHVIALRNATFDVAEGEVFVVMGLSGSGKSTLVRCLLRLIEPSQGQVLVEGQDILRYGRRKLIQFRRKKVAMVFQRFGLLPHRNVLANVAFPLEIEGVGRRRRLARAQEALRAVGLEGWEQNLPHELSGGMQQRVGLARALASESDILLMDEPFSALDPLIRREMQAELIRLQEHFKKTIVFITHDLDEATKIGDRIAIMRDGEIVQIGTPEEIVGAPSDEYVAEFTRDVRRGAILSVRSIMLPPVAQVFQWQGPRVAMHVMAEAERDVAFVVDEEERLLGVVPYTAAAEATSSGATDLQPALREAPVVLRTDVSVEQMLTRVLDYDWRIEVLPVVDDRERLVGEIHRTLVRSLAAEAAAREFSPRNRGGGTPSTQDVPSPT